MKLTLGFSPCPNDTFIFDALVNKKIDTGEFDFDVVLEDVETLNKWAIAGKLDITKLSFPAFFQSLNNYLLLNSGSALGKGVGPLLVTANKQYSTDNIQQSSIVLPGANTTANLLFSFAFPEAKEKMFMRFDMIEETVLYTPGLLGVIIHENRFTYQQRGLHKVADLGELWEEKMKVPVPLGGIAIKRDINRQISLKVDKLIQQSLEYAFANYPGVAGFVIEHSQTMSDEVMRRHIDLYVNQYSLQLGEEGKNAIQALYKVYSSINKSEISGTNSLFL